MNSKTLIRSTSLNNIREKKNSNLIESNFPDENKRKNSQDYNKKDEETDRDLNP